MPATAAPPAPPRHAVSHRLRVAAVDRLTDDAVAVTFDVPPDLREAYRFTQGQHITVRWQADGEEMRRNYSICEPATSPRLRVAVKRLEGGRFSAYVVDRLRPGDELDVMTPTGRFFTPLDPAQARHYVAVAAGSGITPVFSIVATGLEVEPGSRVTLLYGNRTTDSVMLLDELADLKDRYPERLQLLHVLSREPRDAPLLEGRIDGAKLERLLALLIPPDTVDEWFLCGPYDMLTELRATLHDHGVPADHVHAELFRAAPKAPPETPLESRGDSSGRAGASAEVTTILNGRPSTFRLAPDGEPILDAALRVRGEAPYACKSGVCGTCRARLVGGTVTMDGNYALEQDDVARGYVLTCQAHPTSDTVVVDYDA